jgi:hypothetical protein
MEPDYSFNILQEKLKKLPGFKARPINPCVKKDCPKVVDSVDMEDLGDKVNDDKV